NDLIEVYKIKECLVLNRPAYVGMCILDLSKTLMYDFHYNYIKKKYGSRAKLGFTDRDSLQCLVLNRPAYVGMCILDLSKTLMYDFHYNYIKKKYGSRAKLGFTDRDSLRYEITTKNAYKDFRADKDKFGNSDYPKESPFHDPAKKVIGKFKDEAAGMPIREFIGLKSKMYSYVKDNGKNEKTCKGVKKDVIKKSITHENYRDTL
ncbi:unnamed protein product, partial [Porites evermanni]